MTAVSATNKTAATTSSSSTNPVLRQGASGTAVARMQEILKKAGFDPKGIDGKFGPNTLAALKKFQAANGLVVDGICGPKTWAALTGTKPPVVTNPPKDDFTGSFPKVPKGLAEIKAVFGEPGKNQVTVKLPLGPGGKEINVTCHEKIAPVMKAMLAEAKEKGLLKHIKTFDGMYCNRNKKPTSGATSSQKSTHAWGTAFDINASLGKNGQVHPELAALFEKYGFYWGKNFNDEMHFQYARGY